MNSEAISRPPIGRSRQESLVTASEQPLYKLKSVAHKLVTHALYTGALVRQPCEVCGKPNGHAHHDDYTKPLEVRWLCRRHHAKEHRKPAPDLLALTGKMLVDAARRVLYAAIKDGVVRKATCQCGNKRSAPHIGNYFKPLEVEWLCPACHKAWHAEHECILPRTEGAKTGDWHVDNPNTSRYGVRGPYKKRDK